MDVFSHKTQQAQELGLSQVVEAIEEDMRICFEHGTEDHARRAHALMTNLSPSSIFTWIDFKQEARVFAGVVGYSLSVESEDISLALLVRNSRGERENKVLSLAQLMFLLEKTLVLEKHIKNEPKGEPEPEEQPSDFGLMLFDSLSMGQFKTIFSQWVAHPKRKLGDAFRMVCGVGKSEDDAQVVAGFSYAIFDVMNSLDEKPSEFLEEIRVESHGMMGWCPSGNLVSLYLQIGPADASEDESTTSQAEAMRIMEEQIREFSSGDVRHAPPEET